MEYEEYNNVMKDALRKSLFELCKNISDSSKTVANFYSLC